MRGDGSLKVVAEVRCLICSRPVDGARPPAAQDEADQEAGRFVQMQRIAVTDRECKRWRDVGMALPG